MTDWMVIMKEDDEESGNDDKGKDQKKIENDEDHWKTAFPIFYIMYALSQVTYIDVYKISARTSSTQNTNIQPKVSIWKKPLGSRR